MRQPVFIRLTSEAERQRVSAEPRGASRAPFPGSPDTLRVDLGGRPKRAGSQDSMAPEAPVRDDVLERYWQERNRSTTRNLATVRAEHRVRHTASLDADYLRDLGVLLGERLPTRIAARVLDWHQRNPMQSAVPTEPRHYPSLAEQHVLFLACPSYRMRAENLSEGDPRAAAGIARALAGPDTEWVVKTGDRIDYRPHFKTDRSERLANLIDHDLGPLGCRPPPLTREVNGMVGIYDDEVLRRTHHNHLGLRLPKPQGVLVGLFLRQEVEREMAVERATSVPGTPHADASRSSDVAVRVWRRAVAQDENAYVLAFVGEQLFSGDRSAREARLAELDDDEKRKLKRQLPWQHAQFVDVSPLPRPRPRPRGKARGHKGQRKRKGKSVAD